MSAPRPFILFVLGVAIAFVPNVKVAKAETVLSDRLVVSNFTTGAEVISLEAIELPTGEETCDLCGTHRSGGSVGLDPSKTYSFFVFGAATGLPGTFFNQAVVLTEPVGEPAGDHPIFLPGTDLIVSDVVLFTLSDGLTVGDRARVTVSMSSDGAPTFADDVSFALGLNPTILAETGQLQDLTVALGSADSNLRVQVQSDMIPEPGTGALMMVGMLGLAVWRRQRVSIR